MSAEMDALVANATQKLEALEAALYGLEQVRGRFRTEDGAVGAEVDSDGALVALTLSESVTTLPPAEVGQLIVWACRQAAEDAGTQRSKVVATLNESFVPAQEGAAGSIGGRPNSA
ncbi:YbaB/EbfC family DNA-binding protein [Nocardia australiensis]|uniref:YbaB/EbfC family DNA-binding protein n=1 Tax=Nocardia australiensis TaxID=2887191 RepID=UPI001D15BA43|nr:YbaB/EbfC family DNA-binding protein [Nocardia australiensis]